MRLHDLTPAISMVAFPFGKYFDKRRRRPRDDLLLEADRRQHDPGPRQDRRFLRQLGARPLDAQRAGFDDAITLNKDGHISGGIGRQHLPGPAWRRRHAARHRRHPRGITRADVHHADERGARDHRRRAVDRPHGAVARRGGVPRGDRRPDRSDHPRGSPPDRRQGRPGPS